MPPLCGGRKIGQQRRISRNTILVETRAIFGRFFSSKMLRHAAEECLSIPRICRFLPAAVYRERCGEKPGSTRFRACPRTLWHPLIPDPKTHPSPACSARCGLTQNFCAPRSVKRHAALAWRTLLARFRAIFISARNRPISASGRAFLAYFCPLSRLLRAIFRPKAAR